MASCVKLLEGTLDLSPQASATFRELEGLKKMVTRLDAEVNEGGGAGKGSKGGGSRGREDRRGRVFEQASCEQCASQYCSTPVDLLSY